MKLKYFFSLACLSLLMTTHAQVPGYVPTTNLKAWWSFSGNTNDQSGTGNNLTNYGATISADRDLTANSAYLFDGVNDYVDVGNQAGNNLRTLELWFQPIQNIDSTNSQFRSLFIRNTSNQFDEVFLYFVPTFQTTNPGAGRLSFGYNLSSTIF